MEIGFLLREWNELQEQLASLFTTLLRIPNTEIARAIWYAVQSDRFQRKMLLGAASAIFNPSHPSPKADAAKKAAEPFEAALWDEIQWIIKTADCLGQRRDAAAHAPVALVVSDPVEFIGRHFHHHPLAESLRGKKLLDEFRLYRARTATLRLWTETINSYVRTGKQRPLPQRPPWPERPAAQKGAKENHKERAK
jgi:hypothetical protein